MFGFRKKKPMEFSTFYQDYYAEQIKRIRQGKPIIWLPDTPREVRLKSMEIDRLNEKLDAT